LYKIEILDFEKISEERDDPVTSTLARLFSGFIGENNFGLLTFFVMLFAIFASYFWLNKKTVIIFFSLIIFVNILFWSASHVSFGRDSILGRYLVTTFPFFSMIISFLLVSCFQIKSSQKFQNKKKVGILTLKILVFIGLGLLLGVAWYNSPTIQWIGNENKFLSKPSLITSYYPLEMEGISQNSIIVGGHSAKNIDYGFSTFDPTLGMPIQRSVPFNPELLNPEVMKKMKSLIENGESLFIFKDYVNKNEKIFRQVLVDDYGYVLKDYSKSFCKLEISENDQKLGKELSDKSCF
jgi:hypothetical protein